MDEGLGHRFVVFSVVGFLQFIMTMCGSVRKIFFGLDRPACEITIVENGGVCMVSCAPLMSFVRFGNFWGRVAQR
jgi:hypothetical protein